MIEYKRKFSLLETYKAFVLLPRAMSKFLGNNRSKLLSRDFIERMQLAVTEVNGCVALCRFKGIS